MTAPSILPEQVRPQDTHSQRFKVLECYAMMAGKQQDEVRQRGRGEGGARDGSRSALHATLQELLPLLLLHL